MKAVEIIAPDKNATLTANDLKPMDWFVVARNIGEPEPRVVLEKGVTHVKTLNLKTDRIDTCVLGCPVFRVRAFVKFWKEDVGNQ